MNRSVRIAVLGAVAGTVAVGVFAVTDTFAAAGTGGSPHPVPTTSIVSQEPAGGTVVPTPVAPPAGDRGTTVAATPVPTDQPRTAAVAPTQAPVPTPTLPPWTDAGIVTVAPTPAS